MSRVEVAWLELDLPGRIGLMAAPGSQADLTELSRMGVDLLVPLVEDHELAHLDIAWLPQVARTLGMSVLRLPIVDMGVPDRASAASVVAEILTQVRGGGTAVVHCRGGLGRTGTLAACCLVEGGVGAEQAVAAVRLTRPGAIETQGQRDFVHAWR